MADELDDWVADEMANPELRAWYMHLDREDCQTCQIWGKLPVIGDAIMRKHYSSVLSHGRGKVPWQVTRRWTVLAADAQDAVRRSAAPGAHPDVNVTRCPCPDWPGRCTHDPSHAIPAEDRRAGWQPGRQGLQDWS